MFVQKVIYSVAFSILILGGVQSLAAEAAPPNYYPLYLTGKHFLSAGASNVTVYYSGWDLCAGPCDPASTQLGIDTLRKEAEVQCRINGGVVDWVAFTTNFQHFQDQFRRSITARASCRGYLGVEDVAPSMSNTMIRTSRRYSWHQYRSSSVYFNYESTRVCGVTSCAPGPSNALKALYLEKARQSCMDRGGTVGSGTSSSVRFFQSPMLGRTMADIRVELECANAYP